MPLSQSPVAPTAEERYADALLWQGRYRVVFLPLLGLLTVALQWFGVISVQSVFAPTYAERTVFALALALMLAYVVSHRLLTLYLTRRKRAGMRLVIAVIASDVVALFGGMLLVTPPEHYGRALIVSIFALQVTQLCFGGAATIATLFMIAGSHAALLAYAADVDRLAAPSEEFWTLGLYGIGVMVSVGVQGHLAKGMQELVRLLGRAQEGDFSGRYDEGPEKSLGPISVIGHAYNRMRDHLQAMVLTDPLSGCFNRRGLNQVAAREVLRAIRGKKDMAVLAIDLDHFKRINDDYGHLSGDEVIREIGELLRATSREIDVVARFGGEEFTILAPESGSEGGMILAERVLKAFRSHRFRFLPPDFTLTTSIGVAAAVADDDAVAQTLLARADEALYVAKRNGRNRAELWHEGMRAFDGSMGGAGRGAAGMLRETKAEPNEHRAIME